jgi:RND family efflux transporter MFP subunit
MKALVAILAISTTLAAGSAVYLSATRPTLTVKQQTPAAMPAVAMTPVAESRPMPAVRTELVGRLAAASEMDVRATAGGVVLHARVDPGDLVQKGQTLIELENTTLEDTVRRAEMALQQAKSDDAQQRSASAEQHRRGRFGRGMGGGGPLFRVAQNDEQLAHLRVAEAETALQRARQALDEIQVVAPTSGYVADRRVTVGDRVDPGTTVVRMMDLSTLKFVVDAGEGSDVSPSAREAAITFDTLPDRQFVGRVIRSLGGDAAGHAAVSIEVANPDRVLKPGMLGHARLVSGSLAESGFASMPGRFGSLRRESRSLNEGPDNAELLRGLLTNMKALAATLAVAADTQTKALVQKQEATKITVEATMQYFRQLEREVTDLRPDNAAHHAVNLEKAADEIDNLPILHVDEELLTFTADCTKNLRAMAERRRAIARTRSNTDVTVSEEAQAENSAIRTQGMQRITIGLADLRRKLTKKYNLEFLANANTGPSKRHTTRR